MPVVVLPSKTMDGGSKRPLLFFLCPGNPAHSRLRDLRLHRHTTQQGITAVNQVFAGKEVKKAVNRRCKGQQAEKPIADIPKRKFFVREDVALIIGEDGKQPLSKRHKPAASFVF